MRKLGSQLIACLGSVYWLSSACVVDNPSFDAEFDSQGGVSTTDQNQIGATETDGFGDSGSGQGLGPAQFDEDSAGGCEVYKCVSINENAQHRSDYGPYRDNRYASAIVAEQDLLVVGAEVMTGDRIGRNSLSVWRSKDFFPSTKQSEGSWYMDTELGWQGTFFSEVTPVNEGELFWIVWEPVGGSEGTIAISGVGVEALYQSPGGSWKRSGKIPYMIRVYCCDDDER